ncbi:MAG: tetratricopeptide repeat protein [Candidatus Omnitrophota bacterium]
MLRKIPGIIVTVFLCLFLANCAFAAVMDEVEGNYQSGLKYGNQGNLDLAIESFQKVVSQDPLALPQDYYKQTFADAYLNLGILYAKKSDFTKSTDSLNKALVLAPGNSRAMYYLALTYSQLGEIAQTKLYYDKFKALSSANGQANDFLSNFLANYQDRERSVAYTYYFNPNKNANIAVKGDSSADDQLIRDSLTAIEKLSLLKDLDSVAVSAQVIRQNQQGTLIIEKWTVGPADNRKDFWVKYNFNPPPDFPNKVMLIVSDREMTLDEK